MVMPKSAYQVSVSMARAKPAQATSRGWTRRERTSLVPQDVADVADRLDADVGHLGTDPGDRDVDDVAAGVEAVAPDVGQQLRAAADDVDTPQQVVHQGELALGEVRRLGGTGEPAGAQVEPEPRG